MKQDLSLNGFFPGQIALLLQWQVYTCGNKVWYLLEEELLIIPIGFAREQAHSSQPSLLVGFGAVEARGCEHWLTWAGNSISFLLGPAEICQCVYLCSSCCTRWCSVRNPLPQCFYHGWMQAQRAMIYFLTTCHPMITACIVEAKFPKRL